MSQSKKGKYFVALSALWALALSPMYLCVHLRSGASLNASSLPLFRLAQMIFFLLVNAGIALAAPELDGVWRQDCRGAHQREEFFQGESATFTERNFSDLICSRAAIESISRGTIVLGDFLPNGARQIDFVFTSVHMKPSTEQIAEHYRTRRICGYRDWAVGVEREVTGRECDFFGLGSVVRVPAAGSRKFGIVKIEAEALYFGELSLDRDGSTPEKRPLVLDLRPYKAVH